jgi:hypothetical protein
MHSAESAALAGCAGSLSPHRRNSSPCGDCEENVPATTPHLPHPPGLLENPPGKRLAKKVSPNSRLSRRIWRVSPREVLCGVAARRGFVPAEPAFPPGKRVSIPVASNLYDWPTTPPAGGRKTLVTRPLAAGNGSHWRHYFSPKGRGGPRDRSLTSPPEPWSSADTQITDMAPHWLPPR